MAEKKIIINGFWRSGTTFLYLQLYKNYEKALYEPTSPGLGSILKGLIRKKTIRHCNTHPYFRKLDFIHTPYIEYLNDEIFYIIRNYHPNVREGIHHIVYNFKNLWLYLRHFRDFHIKETSLHLYLGEKPIKKYWEPYQIIRHPVDVFVSILDVFYPTAKKIKLIHLQKFHWILRFLMNKLGANALYPIAKELYLIYGIETDMKKLESMSIEETFIISWTIANYQAINSIPKDHIIIYEKLETYDRLPFELKDSLRIKKYSIVRENLSYKFEKIADKWSLGEEYNYLLRFFD